MLCVCLCVMVLVMLRLLVCVSVLRVVVDGGMWVAICDVGCVMWGRRVCVHVCCCVCWCVRCA